MNGINHHLHKELTECLNLYLDAFAVLTPEALADFRLQVQRAQDVEDGIEQKLLGKLRECRTRAKRLEGLEDSLVDQLLQQETACQAAAREANGAGEAFSKRLKRFLQGGKAAA